MKKNIGKTKIDVSRRLKDTAFALRVYSIWAALTFLLFGLLGIYPQARILFKSIQTHKEMEEINKSLGDRINFIDQEALKIKNNAGGVKALDKALPADYEIQNYIVDFSFAVSKTGYNLTGLQAMKTANADQRISVSANLEGNGSIGELVKSIESLDRAAQLNKIGFVEKSGKRAVMCLLDMYILK